jgi:cell division protein FtsW (lipid II flippase)
MNPQPAVVTWYRVYCVATAILYLVLAIFGIVLLVIDPSLLGSKTDLDPMEITIQAIVFLVLGLPLFLAYLTAVFLPAKPWNWIVGMVLICIGLTSCCCLPATIPLLIFWIKPETKTYFGRG